MKEDSLKKRYSIKLFANILGSLIGAMLIAIVPKALGPVAYGEFAYLQSFFTKVIGFLDMGSSIAFFTKLSANHKRVELISFYFLYSFFILIILFLSILSMDLLDYSDILLPNIPINYIYMGLFFSFLVWFTQIFIKISDAYALTVSVELVKLSHRIISVVLLLYFVYFTAFDLELYFYFNYISLVSFLLILSWLFIKKDIFTHIFNLKFSIINLTKEFIAYCHPLLVYSIMGLFAGLFDIWLLQKVAGSIETGFYGLAYGFGAICFLFTVSMTPIITREFAKAYGEDDIDKMRQVFVRYVPMLYSLSAYFGVFVSMQSESILILFTDEKFKDAYLVLVFMALYPIHQTYGQLSGSIFYATGETKLIRNISFFTMPLGMFLTFGFIYILNLGAIGLAMKMLIGQFIGVNIQLYFNSKFLKLNIRELIFHQVYSVLFFVILAYISSHIININSLVGNFLISGFIYTILVIIFTYIFPQVFATSRDEIKQVLIRLKDVIKKQA